MKKEYFNIPNILSMIRLLLVPVYWVLFFNSSIWWAMGVFLLAFFTDMLDGYIARKYNLITSLGKILDPFADKIMQMSAILSIVLAHALHYVFAVLIFIKEIAMIIGGLLMLKKDVVVYSNIFGKLATCAMVVGFFTIFLSLGFAELGLSISATVNTVGTIIMIVALACSYFAGVVYFKNTINCLRKLKQENKD